MKRVFGEAYYRTVVMGFSPSRVMFCIRNIEKLIGQLHVSQKFILGPLFPLSVSVLRAEGRKKLERGIPGTQFFCPLVIDHCDLTESRP